MKKSDDSKKQPFFARFLEAQELEQVEGGKKKPVYVTLKYPSDNDEYPGVDL